MTTLVTGGAGFIGTNLAHALLSAGERVRIVDNLSRPGVERNLRFLRDTHGDRLDFRELDVCDRPRLREALGGVGFVFHLAAQVAVTTSLDDPLADFETNLAGTVRLLEELRRLPSPPGILFTSTNKVYGSLEDVALARAYDSWLPVDDELRERGVSERRPLQFRTPYGCSKGAADQYVLDWAKSYGLPACVFRMSCIYGPHQHGNEDQGWVAHFLLRTLADEPLTIYGDGAQVRDVLHVADLVRAFLLVREGIDTVTGRAFNVGGGPDSTLSLLELVDLLEELHGARPRLRFAAERPGDQRWYVSDTSLLQTATGWSPRIGPVEGVGSLYHHLLPAEATAA
jgi:CDP-paratose 2-epimerase